MTLKEIADGYEASAVLLRSRLRELRTQLKAAEDPEEIWHLKRRIAELTPILTQCNKLRKLCANYYERGYYRDEAYCFQRNRSVSRSTHERGCSDAKAPEGGRP